MTLRQLWARSDVQAARACIRALEEETLREQLRIVAIAAPSFQEERRARYLAARFCELRLADVQLDEVGNAVGTLPGSPSAPPLVVAAHLDTVFPADTPLEPRRVGQRVFAPGITDNARGLAALLAVARTLADAALRPDRTILFAATVGEEGLGDLRGVKHLFRERSPWRAACGFISLDGSGIRRVVHRAIGSRRLRVTLTGPGGHSWSDWGCANPIHAIGTAIEALQRIEVPPAPATTLTVARIGGGTSVNAIPGAAWMEIDLRSESAGALAGVESAVRAAIDDAVEGANLRRRSATGALEASVELIGDRPSGTVDADAELVRAALAATRAVGGRPELAASSTDANVPISLGIPSVTLGAGGESGGIHTPEEWFSNRDGGRGLERALLTTIAASGVAAER